MLSPLDKLKQKVQSKSSEGSTVTSLYYLIKELHCLSEVIGREFEVEYEEVKIFWKFKWFRIKRIRQLPMSIPTLLVLFKEMQKDIKLQEKEMKKSQRKGRR